MIRFLPDAEDRADPTVILQTRSLADRRFHLRNETIDVRRTIEWIEADDVFTLCPPK